MSGSAGVDRVAVARVDQNARRRHLLHQRIAERIGFSGEELRVCLAHRQSGVEIDALPRHAFE